MSEEPEGLPELPSGSRDGINHDATAALAGEVRGRVVSARLTKAQINLLARLNAEPVACRPTRGSSAVALYIAGYAEWDDRAGGGRFWLNITPAGREALKGQD